jgi:hypothetical protein
MITLISKHSQSLCRPWFSSAWTWFFHQQGQVTWGLGVVLFVHVHGIMLLSVSKVCSSRKKRKEAALLPYLWLGALSDELQAV